MAGMDAVVEPMGVLISATNERIRVVAPAVVLSGAKPVEHSANPGASPGAYQYRSLYAGHPPIGRTIS